MKVYTLKTRSIRSRMYRMQMNEKMRLEFFKGLRAYVLQRSQNV